MDRHEFLQQLTAAVELHGLPVGDRQSAECLRYTAANLCCRGCEFEKGCATYATVLWNMWIRMKKGLKVDQQALDDELQKQVTFAKAGILPQKEEF